MNTYYPRSTDPVRDAEEWASREDTRPVLGICPVCSEPVHEENNLYEKDDAYCIDGYYIHEDCIKAYLNREGYRI